MLALVAAGAVMLANAGPNDGPKLSTTPEWQRRERRLKVGTIAAGAGTAVALVGVLAAAGVLAAVRDPEDPARSDRATWAIVGFAELAGVGLAVTVGFGATLQAHRMQAGERASPLRRITPMERAEGIYDARRDPAWVTRDNTLSGWMYGSGLLMAVSVIPTAVFMAADLTGRRSCDGCEAEGRSRALWISSGALAVAGAVGLSVSGGLRSRHRAPFRRWQLRLVAGGLQLRF